MDNPEVTKFCNEGLRPCATLLGAAYYATKQLVESYDAAGMGDKLGNDPSYSTIIEDGSAADGRPALSVGGVKLTIANLRALITQLETTDAGTGLSLVQGILSISPRYQS